MQNVKKQRRKRVIRSVIHVSIALIISIIPLFCCAFSTNAYYQEYFAILNPVSNSLKRYNTGNGTYNDIGTAYGFSLFSTYRQFNPSAISGGHALDLYRYRTSTLYTIPAGEYAFYSATFTLSNNRVLQNGSTYRFRFYVESGTSISRSTWWAGSPESIQRYIDEHLYSSDADFWLSYLDLGIRRVALIPSAETTFRFADGNDRYILLYDFTLTMESGIQDPVIHVSNRFDFNFDNQATTQFTCGVSQCSIYEVFDSSADAPIFPGLDNSVVDDFNNQSSQLEDFAASQDSAIAGYLNPDFSGAPEFTEAMLGISHIIDKYVFRIEPVQRILGMGVAIGLICVLFGIGAVYARARFDREDQEERQREREIARENREVERALERDKRDRYNRSYEKYASDRARREQYAQRYNKEKKGE